VSPTLDQHARRGSLSACALFALAIVGGLILAGMFKMGLLAGQPERAAPVPTFVTGRLPASPPASERGAEPFGGLNRGEVTRAAGPTFGGGPPEDRSPPPRPRPAPPPGPATPTSATSSVRSRPAVASGNRGGNWGFRPPTAQPESQPQAQGCLG
jgi:hypothetical protein